MTLRRILTITTILLVLVGLLFGASWFFSRRTAEKNGTTPLTFRQFLGIGTPAAPGQNVTNEFVSQFTIDTTADKNNNGVPDGEEDLNFNGSLDKNDIILSANGQRTGVFNERVKNSINIKAIVFSRFGDTNTNGINDWNEDVDQNGEVDGTEDKDGNDIIDGYDPGGLGTPDGGGVGNGGIGDNGGFTNGPLIPTGGSPTAGGGPTGGPDTTSGNGPDTGPGTDTPDITPVNTTPPTALAANSCSEADTNISFTAGEIARLNALRARFDTLTETLYDDTAADEQLSFYSSFKIKELQTAELMNYCRAKLPFIADPKMKRLVPTPFYHDSALDANTFTNNPIATSDDNNNSKGFRPLFDNPITATTFLERVFRIDIW